ncbi:MAG: Crp/Fnr family transcriptional regulator [Phormidesmis sp.]
MSINALPLAAPPSKQFVSLIEQLYQERSLITHAPTQSIPLRANYLYLVYRGVVQLHTIHPDGSESIVGLCGPTTAFGSTFTQIDPYWATALTEVDLLPLGVEEIEASPTLIAGLFPQVVRRLQQTEAWLSIAGKRLVADRLKCLLVQIAQDFGQVSTQGVQINIRLTHHQLATIIGTTRVTVTRLLKDFRNEGWLDIQKRQIILSPEAANLCNERS